MEWTLKEQMKFLAEAKTATEDRRDRKIIQFECPLCAGKAYAMRNDNNIAASCSDCLISQNVKV